MPHPQVTRVLNPHMRSSRENWNSGGAHGSIFSLYLQKPILSLNKLVITSYDGLPIVEVIEGPSHHDTKVVSVLAARSALHEYCSVPLQYQKRIHRSVPTKESLHLWFSKKHDIVVIGPEQFHVRIPERVFTQRSLMNDMQDDLN